MPGEPKGKAPRLSSLSDPASWQRKQAKGRLAIQARARQRLLLVVVSLRVCVCAFSVTHACLLLLFCV